MHGVGRVYNYCSKCYALKVSVNISNVILGNEYLLVFSNLVSKCCLKYLSEIKRISELLFPLKLPEDQRFFDDFRGNRS